MPKKAWYIFDECRVKDETLCYPGAMDDCDYDYAGCTSAEYIDSCVTDYASGCVNENDSCSIDFT